jgi:uncharacterized protein
MVHISQLSSQFVRDPHDFVSVGQIVQVWVLELDKARRRVALTMIPPVERERQQRREDTRKEHKARRAEQRQSAPPATGAPADGGGRPAQPAKGGGRPQRRDRPPREPEPRTYVAAGPKKPAAPISKAMQEGKEPLRTFGDLKQFLEKKNDAGTDEHVAPPS